MCSSDLEKADIFEHLVSVLETETGLDREAALANMRFSFIEALCAKTVVRPHESREHKRSMAIDRILTGKYTAIPCFIGIMALVFVMTFSFIGVALSDLMGMGIDTVIALLDGLLGKAQVNPVVHSLVIDGVCSGVGSVLSLLPTIVTMFFFLSILEDTGYIARVAFCYGQAAPQNWPFREKHCAYADWIWLLGSCDYGNQNTIQ